MFFFLKQKLLECHCYTISTHRNHALYERTRTCGARAPAIFVGKSAAPPPAGVCWTQPRSMANCTWDPRHGCIEIVRQPTCNQQAPKQEPA